MTGCHIQMLNKYRFSRRLSIASSGDHLELGAGLSQTWISGTTQTAETQVEKRLSLTCCARCPAYLGSSVQSEPLLQGWAKVLQNPRLDEPQRGKEQIASIYCVG